MWRFFHQWGSPKPFYELSGRLLPWVGTLSVLVLAAGLSWGLLFAPADYQQGHSVRIMYIHVPAAIVAQSSYVLMALCALVSLIWRMKLADVAFTTLAPIGAVITALAAAPIVFACAAAADTGAQPHAPLASETSSKRTRGQLIQPGNGAPTESCCLLCV